MTEEIKNGDYVLRDGAFSMLDGEDALLQSLRVLLQCPRGQVAAAMDFGSRLRSLQVLSPADRVLAMARQAAAGVDGVCFLTAQTRGREIRFTLLLNGQERQVCVAV